MLTSIAAALSQQQTTYAQGIAQGIASGASVVPDLKAFNQHVGDTRTAELNPTMRIQAQMQGTSSEFIAVSHYEGCAGVIDGANYSVQTPLQTSIMYDSFGRAVEGGPGQGMDLYATQTTPGVPIITGTKNTKGVAFLSHLFIGDGAALDPYGTFSFTDPVTGKSYSAHSTEDKVQKQPRLRVNIGDGLKFGAATGDQNVGKPVEVRLADKMGLQLVDDVTDTSTSTHKAVAVWPDMTSIGFNDTGQIESLIGKGGNGSDHLKAGDGIIFLPGAPPTDPPVLTPHAGSGLAINTSYDYAFANVTSKGDTSLSPIATIVTDTVNRNVQVDIAAQPAGTVGTGIVLVRRVSERAASGSDPGSPAGTWKTVFSITGPLTTPFFVVDSIPSTGLGADYTESATSINTWFAATATNPGSLAAIPGTNPALFNISGMKYGGDDGKGNMVNLDPAALKIDPVHGWITTVGSGGGGGGTGGGAGGVVALSVGDNVTTPNIVTATASPLSWDAIRIDHGGWASAGTDLTGPTIVIPTTGTYRLSAVVEGDFVAPEAGEIMLQVWKNGTRIYFEDYEQEAAPAYEFPTMVLSRLFDFAATDAIQIQVYNPNTTTIRVDAGTIDLNLVQGGGGSGAVLRLEGQGAGFFASGATDTVQWTTTDKNIGGFAISGGSITIPATGEYAYSFVSDNFGHGSNDVTGVAEFQLKINGSYCSRFDYRTQTEDPGGPINVLGTMVAAFGFSATAGDIVTIDIYNSTSTTLDVGSSVLMMHRVA